MTTMTKVNNSPEFKEVEDFFTRPLMLISHESFITYSTGPCEQEFTRKQLIYLKDRIEETLEIYDKMGLTDDHISEGNMEAINEVFRNANKARGGSKKKELKKGYVYLIQNTVNKTLKIGFSKNPEARLKTLSVASADPLELINFIPGTPLDEENLHKKFSHIRLNSEWFAYSGDIFLHF